MKLLITGATGLVGNELVKMALKQGMIIHYLTTHKSKTKKIIGAHGFYWNPSLQEIDFSCFEGVDVIIHLAGATISKRWTAAYKKIILASRVNSTKLLENGIKKTKCKHQIKQIIGASAVGIYSNDFNNIVTEETEVSPNSFLERVVIDWESASDIFNTMNIKVTTLRIGLVIASNGGVVAAMRIPILFGLGAAFGNGSQGQSWIHIKDLVGMILFSVTTKLEGIYNAVSPNPVSQTHFITALAKAVNRPHILPPLPEFIIQLMVGEMSSLLLNSHWVSSKKIEDQGFSFQYPEINTAFKELFKKSMV
jgi:uncharacterized protein (TIGR01777 family)